MIKYYFLLIVFFAAAECSDSKSEGLETNSEVPEIIGNTKDAHGCLTSTGSSWSELKRECIQPFKEGQRLNPVNLKVNDVVISAFILLSEDKSQMELFLPNSADKNIILEMTDDNTFENGAYAYKISDASLYINSIKRYTLED